MAVIRSRILFHNLIPSTNLKNIRFIFCDGKKLETAKRFRCDDYIDKSQARCKANARGTRIDLPDRLILKKGIPRMITAQRVRVSERESVESSNPEKEKGRG